MFFDTEKTDGTPNNFYDKSLFLPADITKIKEDKIKPEFKDRPNFGSGAGAKCFSKREAKSSKIPYYFYTILDLTCNENSLNCKRIPHL